MDIGCYPERTSSRARQPDIRCITPNPYSTRPAVVERPVAR
jgi:hypothetical protein